MTKLAAAIVVFGLLAAPARADRKLDEAVAKAEEQLSKGKPDDALKTQTKFAEQNPSGEAYAALARLQARLGNLDDAAATLTKAKDASAPGPARAEALAALAELDLLRGSGKDALAHATDAVGQVKAAPPASALAALARAQVRTQDAAGALQTADKAGAAFPTSAAAHEARGEALLGLGRFEDAIAAFRKALELDPRSTLARIRLSSALLAQGNKTEAVAEAKKASDADQKSGEAFAALGTAILGENPKNWADAIAQAQQGAFLNPKSPLVQVAVGKIFEANGNFEQAAAAYKKALETDPGYGPARLALVQAQIAKGDKEGAFAEAQRLATDMPNSGEAQLELGRLLLRKEKYTDAIPALERATTLTPGIAESHALLGRAYQFTNPRRSDDAAEEYKKAVELDPKNVDYRTTFGLLLGITGQSEAGIAELKKVIATPGYKDSAAHVNLGWIYRNINKAPESIAAYKRALDIDPKGEQAAQAALGLGWAHSYTKSYDDSIADFNRALQIEPKKAGESYDGIAWCYFFKKDMAQARAFMEKAQAATPPRNDTRLKENIDRVEKFIKEGHAVTEEQLAKAAEEREKAREQEKRIEVASDGIRGRTAAQRIKSAHELTVLIGPNAIPSLVWLLQTDKDYSVREASANDLGSLGPGAHSAIPNLKACLNAPNIDCINCSKEEMDAMMKQSDVKRACRDALQKIQK